MRTKCSHSFQCLYFFNTPRGLTKTRLLKLFYSKSVQLLSIRMFPVESEKSSGLIEFQNEGDAVWAILQCNNTSIKNKGN